MTSDYLRETRRRAFCGACEAGVEHDCDAYDDVTEDQEGGR